MPACDQVRLLLGPFDDGELEPHEMEDVALHVVSCSACKATLEDYRSLGVALRDSATQPPVEGFTRVVLQRVDRVPQPLWLRVSRYFDSIAERFGPSVALLAAGALAALVTVSVVTPYAHRLLSHRSSAPVLALSGANDRGPPHLPGELETPQAAPDADGIDVFGGPEPAGNVPSASSATDDSPMIAVSDDPATTVIWIPGQP